MAGPSCGYSTIRRSFMRDRVAGRLWCGLSGLIVLACVLIPARPLAQSAPPVSLTINEAVQAALKNYPAIKERRARGQAAAGSGGVARTGSAPPLDLVWPAKRGPGNHVFGAV